MSAYNILHLEDSKTDADLVKRLLHKAGLDFRYFLAPDKESYLRGLSEFTPNVILSDHTLPGFNSKMAYEIYTEKKLIIPFILVTGTVSEEFAVDMMKTGVDDYLLKSNLQRLPQAITQAYQKRENSKKIKAAETALIKSNHLFNAAFFTNPTPMIISRVRDGQFIEVNPSFVALMEYSREELIGKTSMELNMYDPGKRAMFLSKLATLSHLKNEENLMRTKSGKWKTVLFSVAPIELEDEPGMLITLLDMTGLRDAEHSYRNIFENTQEGIYQSSPEGRFIRCNPAMAKMFGYASAEELIASVKDIAREIYADPQDRINMRALVKQETKVIGYEFKALKKNKETIWVKANIHINKDAKGAIQYYEGTLEDITKRKEAEERLAQSYERFKLLAENMSDMVGLHNPQGDYTYVSPSCEKILGYKPEELIGVSPFSIMHPEDLEVTTKVYEKCFLTEASQTVEHRFKAKNGDYIWLESTCVSTFNEEKTEVIRIQSASRDISEWKKSEEKLNEYLKSAG